MVRIEVTAEHIARAKRRHAGECPVAQAVSEALGRQVRVIPAGWWFDGMPGVNPLGMTTDQMQAVSARIDAYDAGQGMEPFTLTLPYEGVAP